MVAAAFPGFIAAIVMDVLHVPAAAVAWLGTLPGTVALVTPCEAALLAAGTTLPMILGCTTWRTRPAVDAAVCVISALAAL